MTDPADPATDPIAKTEVDWQSILFSPNNALASRLLAQANRRYNYTADAEAAYNYALEKVSVNNWAQLASGFCGRGDAGAFLQVTFVRLMLEYGVKKYGRKRPPRWVQALGESWKRIYQMLCLQRLLPETIVDQVSVRSSMTPNEIRLAIAQIKQRIPACGQYLGEYTLDQSAGDVMPPSPSVTRQLEASQAKQVLAVLAAILRRGSAAPTPGKSVDDIGDAIVRELTSFNAASHITDQERSLLKMVYQEGLSISQVARLLGTKEYTLRRKHKALVKRLKSTLTQFGLDAGVLEQLNER